MTSLASFATSAPPFTRHFKGDESRLLEGGGECPLTFEGDPTKEVTRSPLDVTPPLPPWKDVDIDADIDIGAIAVLAADIDAVIDVDIDVDMAADIDDDLD